MMTKIKNGALKTERHKFQNQLSSDIKLIS